MLTRSVRVDLLDSVDGSTGSADRGSTDIPNGSTSVTVSVYVNNSGFPSGRYDVGVQLGSLPTIEAQLPMTTYGRISTTSPTYYAWKKRRLHRRFEHDRQHVEPDPIHPAQPALILAAIDGRARSPA